jgi:hypothetical protein
MPFRACAWFKWGQLAMTPHELVEEYHYLYVDTLRYRGPSFSPPIENYIGEWVCVDGYRSTLTSKANKARAEIRKWLTAKSKIKGSGIETLHEGKEWRIMGTMYDPIPKVTDGMILATVNGKGSPQTIATVLRVVSMMTYEDQKNAGLLGADNVYDFVKFFVGVDCNGFVANYIKRVNPAHAHVDVNDYRKGVKRTSLSEVKALDLLFAPPSQTDHIAIINHVEERSEKSITCYVSESRGADFGGARTSRYKLRLKNGSWALNSGGADRMMDEIWAHPDLSGVIVPSM